ncbi:MAG: sialate O-acetylesterase [Actinomycetes bacterium]
MPEDLIRSSARRPLAGIVVVAAFVLGAGALSASSLGHRPSQRHAAPLALGEPPSTPRVTVIPGGFTVHVHGPVPPGASLSVRSEPPGVGCVTVTTTCTIINPAATTRFRLQAAVVVGDLTGPWSALSDPVRVASIVVVAGQSNALGTESWANDPSTGSSVFGHGRGSAADAMTTIVWKEPPGMTPPESSSPVGTAVPLTTPQTELASPLYPGGVIIGPEVGLARGFGDAGIRHVTIVKVAFGGSSLNNPFEWRPRVGPYYQALVTVVTKTLEVDAAMGVVGSIRAINWYQGESEALHPHQDDRYALHLATLVDDLREDLPIAASTPFVLAQESVANVIGNYRFFKFCTASSCDSLAASDSAVRSADVWVASHREHVAVVDTKSLQREGVQIHLSRQGEISLGWKLATADLHQ